jgi:predicted N-acyltransferase
VDVRVHDTLDDIPAAAWDALDPKAHPFLRHAFLAGLERHGCLRDAWGWTPRHLALWQGDRLLAALPAYRKDNSHGEFVFDHAWAHAWAMHGQDYYPKWLCAVPYTPVTGPRLLGHDSAHRQALLQAFTREVAAAGWSSAHVNFHPADDATLFGATWLSRTDLQYHWHNPSGWRDFEDYLAAFDHKHRKNIRQERARVARSGLAIRVVHGDEASDDELAAMHALYCRTFAEHGNAPALTLDFLRHLARAMPRALVLVLAMRASEVVAGALSLRSADTLYGRYWGSHEHVPGLHFELCYYRGIEYCLEHGLARFEPGAQGEHKLARGFLPVLVHSHHWLGDRAWQPALAAWCAAERADIERYRQHLLAHSPFREAVAS